MNQDEKMVLLIVQESLVEGDASPARQKDLAEMLNRVISGGLTPHAPDACPVCGGSGAYDTLETVEPCPLCKNGQAQVM